MFSLLARFFHRLRSLAAMPEIYKKSHWLIDPPSSLGCFLKLLPELMPAEVTLWLCGVSDSTIVNFMNQRPPKFRKEIPVGWYYPRVRFPDMRVSLDNCRELGELIEGKHFLDVCNEILCYDHERDLLLWSDLGSDPIYVAGTLPEETVKTFCDKLGVSFRFENVARS